MVANSRGCGKTPRSTGALFALACARLWVVCWHGGSVDPCNLGSIATPCKISPAGQFRTDSLSQIYKDWVLKFTKPRPPFVNSLFDHLREKVFM